jgi:hypothetical protein
MTDAGRDWGFPGYNALSCFSPRKQADGRNMRILIDAKDLINVVEQGKPVSVGGFDTFLRKKNASLALTWTNVSEFVAPISRSGDFLSIRPLLQRIESLPVCYLRETSILPEEILAALDGFAKGQEPRPINPYVRRWDYTFNFIGPVPTARFVGYRLDEIVHDLFREYPGAFEGYASRGPLLRRQFAEDRKLFAKNRQDLVGNFVESLRRDQKQWNLNYRGVDVDTFGHWIYENPARCPGLRLTYDMRHEILANPGDIPLDSDIPDFTHVFAIPYVDARTIDRRMMHYLQTVTKKLRKINPAIEYDRQTYRRIEDLMKALF